MIKISGVALLAVAGFLLVWGLDASGSIQSGFSRFFRGVPTDTTVWLFVASAVVGMMGLGLLIAPKTPVA